MGLDKAIEFKKEHRKPYRGAKAVDRSCRNHGSCLWCRRNRMHKFHYEDEDEYICEQDQLDDPEVPETEEMPMVQK